MAGRGNFTHLDSIFGQEIGRKTSVGTRDWRSSSLYASFSTSQTTVTTNHQGQDWGAVFGFGFSPDGKILTAACEHRCMQLYDPLNAKLITRRFQTHDDCVNCVRFLDNRVFATCSDDNTVRLWDCRFLTNELRILRGHSSWVKNIEYASSSGKLVTSGFDGNIFAWDINNYSAVDKADPVFYINGALRTKLTNGEDKLIVSTLGGYFLLIHNLDLNHLKHDMAGFKPHLYRLMQLMNTPLHHALQYNYMFTRRRNRVEFMCDFPDSDNAESIATLQIHPQDWCIVSRNTTLDEDTEWTCVHDIQSTAPGEKVNLGLKISSSTKRDQGLDSDDEAPPLPGRKKRKRPWMASYARLDPPSISSNTNDDDEPNSSSRCLGLGVNEDNGPSSNSTRVGSDVNDGDSLSVPARTTSSDSEESDDYNSAVEEEGVMLMTLGDERHRRAREAEWSSSSAFSFSSQPSSEEPPYSSSRPSSSSSSSIVEPSLNRASDAPAASVVSSDPLNLFTSEDDETDLPSTMSIPLRYRWQRRRMAIVHTLSSQQQDMSKSLRTQQLRIRNVKPRLLCYAEEPNVGRGYIKEQSFSSDGRIIASPFGNHVRLLAFNEQCNELCNTVPSSPRPLVEVSNCALLQSNILSSAFSPAHCLLVAGAVDGSIAFCHPIL